MESSAARLPEGVSERIAEEALRNAIGTLCRGGSWRGVARGLAWQIVAAGKREPRSIDMLSESAETLLGSLIDDALWAVELKVIETWQESLELRPGELEAALEAADAAAQDESRRLIHSACDRVLAALLSGDKRAA